MRNPIGDDLDDIFADGEKEGFYGFGSLGLHLARVLEHAALLDRDMLELEAYRRGVAHSCKQQQREDGSVASLDLIRIGHGEQRGAILLEGRVGLRPRRM